MRRTAVVLFSAAALVVGLVSPANASTTTLVKKVAVDDATAFGESVGTMPCATSGMGSSDDHGLVIGGPADPNASGTSVSWGHAGALTGNTGWGVATAPGRAAAFGTFKIDVYNGPSGTAAVVAVDVDMSTGQPLAIWIGKSPIPAGAQGQWATIDESSATYDWEKLSATGIGDGAAGTSTLAAFSSAHPDGANDRHGYVGFLVFGCYGETGWAINHIQTGTVAAPNVTDLGTLADDVHINAGSNFIVTGQAVGLSGDSQYAGPTSAILSFRPANQSTYSTATRSLPQEPVNDLTCSANGSSCRNPFPVIMAHPVYNTVYRWTYPGGNGVDGAASTFITVHVQAKIAATFPSSLSNNSVLMVPGQLAPACSNTMVTLWGLHGGVKTKMATVSSGEQGSFIIGAGVHGRGSWSFWITSPNDACNAAAKSTTKTYTVR